MTLVARVPVHFAEEKYDRDLTRQLRGRIMRCNGYAAVALLSLLRSSDR